jgi:hypothetical protein
MWALYALNVPPTSATLHASPAESINRLPKKGTCETVNAEMLHWISGSCSENLCGC